MKRQFATNDKNTTSVFFSNQEKDKTLFSELGMNLPMGNQKPGCYPQACLVQK